MSTTGAVDVDLPPEAPSAPVVLPASPPAMPVSQVKENAKQGMAVRQTTVQTVETMPRHALSTSIGLPPGTSRLAQKSAEYIAECMADPAKSQFYSIELHRLKPSKYNGVTLPFGAIESNMQLAFFPEIVEHVKETHGGGSYRIFVCDESGQRQHQAQFNIDMTTSPPIVKGNANIIGGPIMPGLNAGAFGAAVSPEAQQAIVAEREAEALARAEQSRLNAQYSKEDMMEERERRKKLKEDQELNRMRAPAEAERREVEKVREDARNREDGFMKLLLTAVLQKPAPPSPPPDNSLAVILPLIIKSMESSQATMVALITSMGNNKNGTDMTQVLGMITQSQNQSANLMLEVAKTSAMKSDSLVNTLLQHKLEAPADQIQQAMLMQDKGFKQAMAILEFTEQSREPEPPAAGFLDGISRVAGPLLQRLMSGGAQPPSSRRRLLETVAAEQRVPPTINVKPVAPNPGAQTQAQVQPVRPKYFSGVYDVQDLPAQQFAPQAAPAFVESVHEVQDDMQEQQALPTEATTEDVLAEMVDETLRLAILDVKAGRAEHEWVEFALAKWDQDYLQAFVMAPDDATRIELVAAKADPALFEQLQTLLIEKGHQNFMDNVARLLELTQETAVPAGA